MQKWDSANPISILSAEWITYSSWGALMGHVNLWDLFIKYPVPQTGQVFSPCVVLTAEDPGGRSHSWEGGRDSFLRWLPAYFRFLSLSPSNNPSLQSQQWGLVFSFSKNCRPSLTVYPSETPASASQCPRLRGLLSTGSSFEFGEASTSWAAPS